tara:strand:- start:80 stop:208 length:129 start_codon:yes stop_codon:yes gene_type:complete
MLSSGKLSNPFEFDQPFIISSKFTKSAHISDVVKKGHPFFLF